MMCLLLEFYLSTDIDNINFRCTDAVQDGQNLIVGKPGKKGALSAEQADIFA